MTRSPRPGRSLRIRTTSSDDLPTVMDVHTRAFGQPEEAELVRDLLDDPTAAPTLSLIAEDGGRAVGHVLFSSARLIEPASDARAAILAPLAVVPEAQTRGVGGRLIEVGLQRLRDAGVELVFVLGHPGYYPRFGFEPAGRAGLDAPYPIPEANADAWMVRTLGDAVAPDRGRVACADALDAPELWRE